MSDLSLARRAVKAAVLPIGAFERARPTDTVILLYHRVGTGDREIDVDLHAFDRQMAYLASRRSARSLDEALDGRGGVVVTVDDGFGDFHAHVLPVLVRHEIPALLYLATGGVADDPISNGALTWPQVGEAVATGLVSVGSHTHSHRNLSRVDRATAEDEMRRSKELIEDHLGVPCRHFAYPWSVASPAAERVARGLFQSAALRWCTNRHGIMDPHRLGRTPVLRADGSMFFRAKVNGMLDREAFVYRALRRGPWRKG